MGLPSANTLPLLMSAFTETQQLFCSTKLTSSRTSAAS